MTAFDRTYTLINDGPTLLTMADFSKAWRVVKIRGSEYHPQDDVGCCGIIVRQAVEASWNHCPYCGEAIPEGVKELYDGPTGHGRM